VLFKDLAENLAKLVQGVHTIRDQWKKLALRESRYHKGNKRRVGVGHEYRAHWDRLKMIEERFRFSCSESMIEMAKVDALRFLGEDQASFELARKSLLRGLKGPVVEESESAG
jgi:hypothetical protein